jgi:uncharacterized membrane protein
MKYSNNMNKRPEIKIRLSFADRLMEYAGWLLLLALWVFTLINYSGLPRIIPTHFNVAGQPDSYGSRLTILSLPLIGTFVYVGLTILNNYPHIFNYAVTITPENALRQYTIATKMIRSLKLSIIIIFSMMTFFVFRSATERSGGLGVWFLPFTLGILFIPLLYFLYLSVRSK